MDPVSRAREYVLSHALPSSHHGLEHVKRVVGYAREIWKMEGGDWEVLGAAAWLHDVSLLMGGPRETHHEDSARIALEVLGDERVAQVIREHRFSLGMKPTSLESAILQDADRLDAVGAIGLYRTIATGEEMGRELYHPEDPFALNRELDDGKYTVDHFFRKILRIPGKMNTDYARELAERRNEVIVTFLRGLEEELGREGELDKALERWVRSP